MALQVSRFVRNGPKTLVFALALLLLAPAAAWANPSTTCVSGGIPVLCITNIGGTATGGTGGLVLDGTLGSTASTINQIGGFTGNGDLGTISFTTGVFTGNL